MSSFTITVEDEQVLAALQRLRARSDNFGPVFKAIGEDLVKSTKKRFASATAPDGTPWEPNTEVTLMEYLRIRSGIFAKYTNLKTRKEGLVRVGDKKGYYRKDGRLAKKGIDAMMRKRPLAGETGALATQIHYQVIGNTLESAPAWSMPPCSSSAADAPSSRTSGATSPPGPSSVFQPLTRTASIKRLPTISGCEGEGFVGHCRAAPPFGSLHVNNHAIFIQGESLP